MDISKISSGKNFPNSFNVIIEVPMHSEPVKYEFDKDSGAIFVDRFIATPMFYPCNYGFIPHTLADDGDPLDVLVVSDYKIISGAVIEARPIGALIMEDEKGMDEKIIAVPTSSITKVYESITDISHINPLLINQIRHFFENYKSLEKGKWVKVKDFVGTTAALEIVQNCKK